MFISSDSVVFCDALSPLDLPFHQWNFLIWRKPVYPSVAVEQPPLHFLIVAVSSPRLLGALSSDSLCSVFGRKLLVLFDMVPFSVIGKVYIWLSSWSNSSKVASYYVMIKTSAALQDFWKVLFQWHKSVLSKWEVSCVISSLIFSCILLTCMHLPYYC